MECTWRSALSSTAASPYCVLCGVVFRFSLYYYSRVILYYRCNNNNNTYSRGTRYRASAVSLARSFSPPVVYSGGKKNNPRTDRQLLTDVHERRANAHTQYLYTLYYIPIHVKYEKTRAREHAGYVCTNNYIISLSRVPTYFYLPLYIYVCVCKPPLPVPICRYITYILYIISVSDGRACRVHMYIIYKKK